MILDWGIQEGYQILKIDGKSIPTCELVEYLQSKDHFEFEIQVKVFDFFPSRDTGLNHLLDVFLIQYKNYSTSKIKNFNQNIDKSTFELQKINLWGWKNFLRL